MNLHVSDTCKTATEWTATCSEINNNQCCRNQLLGENADETNGELLCNTDTEHIHDVMSTAIWKEMKLGDTEEATARNTGKQITSNGSYRSNFDTEGESTDEDVDETILGNDSDWISTGAFQPTNLDSFLPVEKLKFSTAGLAVFVMSVLCFCVSYDAAGVFDDKAAIWENPDVSQPNNTPWHNVFRNDFWGQDLQWDKSHKSYRPLTTLTFRLSYYMGGGFNSVWFHVPNILLHAIISVLLIRVFSILFGGYRVNLDTNQVEFLVPKSSFLCAMLFAVHPIHTECVAGVVGRADLLCALLFILSFLMYVKSCAKELHETDVGLIIYRPTRFSVWWMLGSSLLCFLAVFCKEQGLTVLGICSAYDIILVCRLDLTQVLGEKRFSKPMRTGNNDEKCNGHAVKTSKAPISRLWISSLIKRQMFLLITGLFTIWLRIHVMGPHPPHFEVYDNPHSFTGGPFTRVLNYNYLYSLNAWILVHPWWLCCDWSMGCIPVIKSLLDLRIFGGVAVWLVLGSLLASCLKPPVTREQRVLSVALAFIVVPYLPASHLFFRVGFVIAERILYLSSIGYCMLVVLGLRRICAKYPKEEQTVRVGVIFLLGVYVVRSVQRTTDWRTDIDLLKAADRVCPLNAKIHYNMGVHLQNTGGGNEEIMERYIEAIRLNPLYTNAFHNMAMLMNKNEKYEEAEEYFERVIQIQSDYAPAWANLAVSKEKRKKYIEAEECYLTALRYQPHYPRCLLNMGRMYLSLKDHNKAMETWWKAIGMDHTDPTGWYNIAVVLHNLERYNKGIDILNRGLSFNSGAYKLLFLLADSYKKAGKWSESETTYLEAIRYHPDKLELYFNLGILYQDWKKYDLAEKYYRKCLNIQPNAAHVIKKLGTLPYHT